MIIFNKILVIGVIFCFNISFSSVKSFSLPFSRQFFATTVKGLEPILETEILQIPGVRNVQKANCGVFFSGDDAVGFRALLWLRTALKLMEQIVVSNGIQDKDSLYNMCQSVDWSLYMKEVDSLKCEAVLGRVSTAFNSNKLSHSHFSALTVKNAIVDQFRSRYGIRPSVNVESPDVCLHLYLDCDRGALYRVWSGTVSMHKRGYREHIHKASLRETTAAAMVLITNWSTSREVLCDPMCGSGTIPIEAALIKANTAPGLIRYEDGKDLPDPVGWKGISNESWANSLKEAKSKDQRHVANASVNIRPTILASDCHRGSIDLAIESSIKAGVENFIEFSCCDILSVNPIKSPDVTIVNPPWNLRLEDAKSAWESLRLFKISSKAKNRLWALTGNTALLRIMKLRQLNKIEFQASNTNLVFSRF